MLGGEMPIAEDSVFSCASRTTGKEIDGAWVGPFRFPYAGVSIVT